MTGVRSFLYAPFSLPGDDRLFTAAVGNDCPHEKNSSTAFSYCSEGLKCVIIRNKLLRTDLFQGGREVLFLIRPSGTVHVEGMEGALWRLRREW